MEKVKIKITSFWSTQPKVGYCIGDEYFAELHPCTDKPTAYYAILGNGYIIPNGHFEMINPDNFGEWLISVGFEKLRQNRYDIQVGNSCYMSVDTETREIGLSTESLRDDGCMFIWEYAKTALHVILVYEALSGRSLITDRTGLKRLYPVD